MAQVAHAWDKTALQAAVYRFLFYRPLCCLQQPGLLPLSQYTRGSFLLALPYNTAPALLQSNVFIRSSWPKLAIVIEKDIALICHMHQHIQLAVSIHIFKGEGNGG